MSVASVFWIPFSALMPLVWWQEGYPVCKIPVLFISIDALLEPVQEGQLYNWLTQVHLEKGCQTGVCVCACSVKAHLTEEERVGKLLDLLRRQDNSRFPSFCESLVATGQRHVVDYLLSDVDPTSGSFPGILLKCCILLFLSLFGGICVMRLAIVQ